MSLLERMISNAVAEEVNAYSQARATMHRPELIGRADAVLTERVTRLVLGQIAEWVSATTRPAGRGPRRTAYARVAAGEPFLDHQGTPNRQRPAEGATEAPTQQLPRVQVGGGFLEQLPTGHARCEACGVVQPLNQMNPFHPDGAPDVTDFLCRNTEACRQRIERGRP